MKIGQKNYVKMGESELDPDRKPPLVPFILQLVRDIQNHIFQSFDIFTMMPLISMLIIIPTSSIYAVTMQCPDEADPMSDPKCQDAAFGGVTVSAMPVAMALALFPLHALFECTGFSYRFMTWFGIFVSIAGQLMYGFSYLVLNKWYLLGARFVMGCGCYQALGKTYIATLASQKNKLYYFMWMGTAAIGVFVFANFLAFVTDIITEKWINDYVNRYTSPAWLMLMLWIIYAVLFFFLWEEPTMAQRGWKESSDSLEESESKKPLVDAKQVSGEPNHEPAELTTSKSALAFVFISALISSILMSSWEVYTADYLFKLNWDAHQSSLYLMGIYGVFLLVAVPFLLPWLRRNKIAESKLMIIPYSVAACASAFFYDYSSSLTDFEKVLLFSIGSLIVVVFGGIPRTAIMSLGSKIVTNKHAGSMQMWITFNMGLGRAIGPPLGSYLSQNAWSAVVTSICAVNVLMTFVWKDNLVPIRELAANKQSGAVASAPAAIKEPESGLVRFEI